MIKQRRQATTTEQRTAVEDGLKKAVRAIMTILEQDGVYPDGVFDVLVRTQHTRGGRYRNYEVKCELVELEPGTFQIEEVTGPRVIVDEEV